jgi:hypothetical protein
VKYFLLAILCVSTLFFASAAKASGVELRYSMMELTPTSLADLNAYNGASFPELKKAGGFGADALVSLPAMPISLGVRYERYSASEENGSGKFESTFERQSLLIAKRYIDSVLYGGLILTVDFGNKFTYKKIQGVETNYKAKAKLTGSIGAELGIKILFLTAGVEGGYLYAPLGNLKFANTEIDVMNGSNPVEIDLSGTYVRAVVGLTF